MPDEDSLRHKYDPLPEEPRYRRKSRKRHVRSDHKHEYETVCVDAHSIFRTLKGEYPTYHMAVRCKVCGRIKDIKLWQYDYEPPDDLPLYEVDDFFKLIKMKSLPDEMRVSE